MKTERKVTQIKMSGPELLAFAIAELKDRVLFPEKLESARAYIKQIKIWDVDV